MSFGYQVLGFGAFTTAALPASATHIAGVYEASSGTTWTQADQSIGAAASDRVIVLACQNNGPIDITGITIGGSAMTALGQVSIVESTLEMFALAYPSGTTATFVTTYASATTIKQMHIYSLTGTGGSTSVSDIATHSGPNAGNSQQISSLSLDVPENGTVIAASFSQAYVNTEGASWVGVDFDNRINATSSQYWEAASKDFESASAGLSISKTWSTGQRVGMIAAAWGSP